MWRSGSTGCPDPGCEGNFLFRRLLLIALFIEIGLLLIAVPWTPFWERNYFTDAIPLLRLILTNDFARGAITGLGLVNLYVGLVDLAYLVGGAVRTGSGRHGDGGDGRRDGAPGSGQAADEDPARLPIEE
jgi:hypothetical protein